MVKDIRRHTGRYKLMVKRGNINVSRGRSGYIKHCPEIDLSFPQQGHSCLIWGGNGSELDLKAGVPLMFFLKNRSIAMENVDVFQNRFEEMFFHRILDL